MKIVKYAMYQDYLQCVNLDLEKYKVLVEIEMKDSQPKRMRRGSWR